MKINSKIIEQVLSHYIIVIMSIYGVYVFIKFNFQFTPENMDYPGMIIAFITSCALNIVRLKENSASLNIQRVSVFANILTLCLATAFTMQGPIFIGEIITTIPMGIITLFSIISLLSIDKKQLVHAQ